MGKLFQDCGNYIGDDNLLLRLLVFMSTEDDIDVLLSNAPVHIVTLHVANIWGTLDKVKKVILCINSKNLNWYVKKLCSRISTDRNIIY